MPASFVVAAAADAIPIRAVEPATWDDVRKDLSEAARTYAVASGFEPKPGRHLVLPGPGGIEGVLFGVAPEEARGFDPFAPGRLATLLAPGDYRLSGDWSSPGLAALGWVLSSYRFTRYKTNPSPAPVLCLPTDVDGAHVRRVGDR